jgi:AraC-like DNA-binding protein
MLKSMRHAHFATNDLDEACVYMQRLLRRRIEPLERGKLHLSITTATLQVMAVTTIEGTGGIRVRTNSEPAMYSLTRLDGGGWDRRGEEFKSHIGPTQGILVPPNSFSDSHLSGKFASTIINIPAPLIQLEAEHLIGERPTRPMEIMEINNLGPESVLGQRINLLLEQLELENGMFEKYPLMGMYFQLGLVRQLIELLPTNYKGLLAKRWGGSSARHVARLEEFIEAHLRDAITIGDMAAAAGVSARTLRDSCQSRRGQTPGMRLRNMRLHAAHRRLQNPEPGDTVASIAREFLFTNAGRFAEYYQKEFQGETPAETLHWGRRKHS